MSQTQLGPYCLLEINSFVLPMKIILSFVWNKSEIDDIETLLIDTGVYLE